MSANCVIRQSILNITMLHHNIATFPHFEDLVAKTLAEFQSYISRGIQAPQNPGGSDLQRSHHTMPCLHLC